MQSTCCRLWAFPKNRCVIFSFSDVCKRFSLAFLNHCTNFTELMSCLAEQEYDLQMSASRTTARNYEMPPSLQASPPGNQVAAANIREERLGGQVFSTRSAPLLTPTKGGHDGHDARGHKSPGGKKAVKRHRAHPSSPLRQMSSRLRTTTPKCDDCSKWVLVLGNEVMPRGVYVMHICVFACSHSANGCSHVSVQ